jgi:hypothetical protein
MGRKDEENKRRYEKNEFDRRQRLIDKWNDDYGDIAYATKTELGYGWYGVVSTYKGARLFAYHYRPEYKMAHWIITSDGFECKLYGGETNSEEILDKLVSGLGDRAEDDTPRKSFLERIFG